jgi:hypothetical protein
MSLAAILAGALAAPMAFAQPHVTAHVEPPHVDAHVQAHVAIHVDVPAVGEHGRRDWKIQHPVVVSHTPLRGKPGQKIVVRGERFGKDTVVVWGGKPIPTASVTENEITFVVPPGAANGTVYLRGGGLADDLSLGDYQAQVDEAAIKAQQDAEKAAAETEWKGMHKQAIKDEKARDAELAQEQADLDKSREERREKYYADLKAKFNAAFLEDANTIAELQVHADRLARLDRIQRLVASEGDDKLGVRVTVDIKRENDRHDRRMAALKAAFKGA